MRLNVNLLLVKFANRDKVGIGEIFEFGGVKSAVLR